MLGTLLAACPLNDYYSVIVDYYNTYMTVCPFAPYSVDALLGLVILVLFVLWRCAVNRAQNAVGMVHLLRAVMRDTANDVGCCGQNPAGSEDPPRSCGAETISRIHSEALNTISGIQSAALSAMREAQADAMEKLATAHSTSLQQFHNVVSMFTDNEE
jgi:hypothetical protein